ncbi:nucleotidyltransferase family protein [Serinibacter salmoneus]|uniref:Molybdenum cofactor cytidylyltransferase/nicotine blue oxidoreductase n=1 Tax=Serinibacter salmoneus TaxID=556530 RepID=A0A2A9CYL0_9MICO|nr:NTP transferase domain-containing protein [Serinibacter salmoneus]PFG18762.1 molybdenum cofactor cytidylyltransferase/nicotine blue oxidoreductase [Serinibacter salmoneus]
MTPTDRTDAARGPVGLVLAAGGGRRFGGPKALARSADGTPWLHLAVRALRAGGCTRVLVALGAGADRARTLLPAGVREVTVPDWSEGLASSLRTALTSPHLAEAAAHTGASGAVVIPVDTPGLPAEAVRRLIAAGEVADHAAALARATYDGRPGHPVLLGRNHWAAIAAELTGDAGAGAYLRRHAAREIPCGDLWDGADADTPGPTGGSGNPDPHRSHRRV